MRKEGRGPENGDEGGRRMEEMGRRVRMRITEDEDEGGARMGMRMEQG